MTVVMRGTAGPAGMIRTQAGAQTGCPAPREFHGHQAGTQTLRQERVHLRDAIRFRFADVREAAGEAVGVHRHIVQIAVRGKIFYPDRERRHAGRWPAPRLRR